MRALALLLLAAPLSAQVIPPSPTVAYPIIARITTPAAGAQVLFSGYSSTTKGIQLKNGAPSGKDAAGRPTGAVVIFTRGRTVDTVGYVTALTRCGFPSVHITVISVASDSASGYKPMPTTAVSLSFGGLVLIP